jgi:hypothetical protein
MLLPEINFEWGWTHGGISPFEYVRCIYDAETACIRAGPFPYLAVVYNITSKYSTFPQLEFCWPLCLEPASYLKHGTLRTPNR